MRATRFLSFAQPLALGASLASLRSVWSRQILPCKTLAPLHRPQPSFFGFVLASMGKKKSQKFYAVHKGRNGFRGVVENWPACQRIVNGVPGAVFKSFATRAEAVVFSEEGRGESSAGKGGSSVTVALGNQPKRPRTSVSPLSANIACALQDPCLYVDGRPGNIESRGLEMGSDTTETDPFASRLSSTFPRKRTITVYTDGACSNNGKAGARAGVGVYFGPDDELNLSGKLAGEAQTNQRAEQTGVLRAMQLALAMGRVGPGDTLCIKTDSNYTVKGLLSWMPGWKDRNWKSSTGGDVRNKDLWQELDAARTALENSGVILNLMWVRGHAGEAGNEAADRLAVWGASAQSTA